NRYEVLSLLGEGGFGMVFKAQDIELNRAVAVKILKMKFADQTDVERFRREARLLAKMAHRNIVGTYSFDLLDDSTSCIVMEYLDGQPLSKIIAEREKLPFEFATNVFLQICDGLSYAHETGIVHRDLSPQNIFLIGNLEQP